MEGYILLLPQTDCFATYFSVQESLKAKMESAARMRALKYLLISSRMRSGTRRESVLSKGLLTSITKGRISASLLIPFLRAIFGLLSFLLHDMHLLFRFSGILVELSMSEPGSISCRKLVL